MCSSTGVEEEIQVAAAAGLTGTAFALCAALAAASALAAGFLLGRRAVRRHAYLPVKSDADEFDDDRPRSSPRRHRPLSEDPKMRAYD